MNKTRKELFNILLTPIIHQDKVNLLSIEKNRKAMGEGSNFIELKMDKGGQQESKKMMKRIH